MVFVHVARRPLNRALLRLDGRRSASTASENALETSPNWTHTLRALLRECTYLPDPHARAYLAQHILSRFRSYQLKKEKSVVDAALQARLQTQHQTAQSALNQLRRANQGEREPLMKALLLSYGRTGKLRWELMRPLLPAEGQDGKGACKPRTANSKSEDGEKPLPSLTPQLHALLLSHARADPPTLTRLNPQVKRLVPDVPELNSWLRPMPQSRVRNLTKRWYRGLLERVLPPLPKEEWERLRKLAQGQLEEGTIAQRRSRQVAAFDRRGASTELKAIITGGRVPVDSSPKDIHRITPRFMRKLWVQVFKQCPMMEWDGDARRWIVVWGEHALNGKGS